MATYLDLQPAPQFDKSLVRYCVINFNRIKDVLSNASKRIYVDNFSIAGPWAQDIQITPLFRCDIVIWCEITAFCYATGFQALGVSLDYVVMPYHMSMWFNEANTHKALSVTNTVRNVAKGNHTIRQHYMAGSALSSDNGDRFRTIVTYYEL